VVQRRADGCAHFNRTFGKLTPQVDDSHVVSNLVSDHIPETVVRTQRS
jgi:hypothetical protein